jgi:hypothetical protein
MTDDRSNSRSPLVRKETAQDWQPIETAPKNKHLLGFQGGMYPNYFETWWVNENIGWIRQPTHWMPLPEPPSSHLDGQVA